MDSKTTGWHAPELTILVRSGEPQLLTSIWGGQPGEEGKDHCKHDLG